MNKLIRLNRITGIALLALNALLIAACATTVKEDERDKNSVYRGFWTMTIVDTPSTSFAGSYRIRCWDLESIGNLQIAGGRIVARVSGYDLAGFVKPNGEFTAGLDLKKDWKFRLRGQLDAANGNGKGKLVHNRSSEGLAGCTSNVELKREAL